MDLDTIKRVNKDPEAYYKSKETDGQRLSRKTTSPSETTGNIGPVSLPKE